jgi:AcrR family transcriptional regulator
VPVADRVDAQREAGVGVGTLYRHFPTRDDPVDAVLEDAFEAVVEVGEAALRADFVPEDVTLVLWGSDRVRELAADGAPDLWRRHLGFVLDGLRASAAREGRR